jgi:hypothetical protein
MFKLSDRYSLTSLATTGLPDSNGKLFMGNFGTVDLSAVDIVGSSIDTVRQLFFGKPLAETVQKFETFESGEIVDFSHPGYKWHFSKMGKVARYRFKLQNNELGIIILFGSYYEELTKPGQHLKIELSPKLISQCNPQTIWDILHSSVLGLSHSFLLDPEPRGVAIHMAVDWQGYQIPGDFLQNFTTRSTTVRTFDGISELDLSGISEATVSYGKKVALRNYMIGKASGLQTVIYNKSVEIVKSDKKDYFHDQWGIQSKGAHMPDYPVYRLENRLHHSVIREIGHFLGVELESFEQVVPYLTDIWRYALDRNRFDIRKAHIHPLWQLFYEDVQFFLPSESRKISRKKKESVDPLAKNIALVLGNFISIQARYSENTAKRVMAQIRMLPFYTKIVDYYLFRGLSESDIFEAVEKGLALRRLIGKAA